MSVAFLGLGIMGSRMAAHLVGRRARADGVDADRRARREPWAAEHGARRGADAGRRRPAARTS